VTAAPEPAKSGEDIEASPTETPVEVQHTPTYPVGTVGMHAEGVTNIPPGTPITVAPDPTDPAAVAAAPTVSPAPGTIEVAGPAPLPRPGDEQLIRGTAAGNELWAELTGNTLEAPDAQAAEVSAREAAETKLEQDREAAEAAQANQQKLLDATAAQQEQQRAAREQQRA